MIINNIDIVAFGQLKDFHLDLNKGLNVIYGDVENGQDTIINFIKMLFYGATSIRENNDASTNERLKYRPSNATDSTSMGGSIDFMFNDKIYKLVRTFKDCNTNDDVTLYNITDNSQIDTGLEHQIGKLLLGVNSQSFERSIFINNINFSATDEKSIQKLMNIISSYDENISADTVKTRLCNAKESYLSKSGKIGILDKNKATLTSLYEDINSAQAEESQKFRMQMEYQAVKENRDEIIARYDELRKTLAIQETMTEVNSLKNTVAKLDDIKKLQLQLNTKKQALTNENVTINDDFIKTAQQKFNTIQQIGEMKNQYQSNVHKVKTDLETMTENLNNSFTQEKELFNEAVEQIEFTNGHIKNLDKAIADKKTELENLSEKIKDADINFRVIDEQVKSKKALDQQRLDIANQQLTDARQPVTYSNPTSSKTFITWGVIIIILGLLLTLTVNIWCSLVIGIGIVMAIINLFDKHNTSKKGSAKYQRVDEVAITKANENIQKVRHDIEIEQYSINKKQREAQKQLNLLKLNKEQLLADCDKYREQKNTLLKNLDYWKNQKTDAEAVFSKEQANVNKKQNELSTLMDNISTSEENFYNAQNDIIQYMSAFKPCSTINDVSELISTLIVELQSIKTLENKIEYQSELLKSETNGQSYDELKEKLMDITADFIEMCGKENPEPMSVAELSKLKSEIDDYQFSLNMQNADLSHINSDMRAKFRNRTCVTAIEHTINHLEREILKQEKFCHSLDLAYEVLNQSIDELNEHMPEFNQKTANVFNQLSDGSYQSLALTTTLDTAIQHDASLTDWKYLGNGTIEQSYISLRLGVSQMISQSSFATSLPIVLNDEFIQYDNEDVLKGINFLADYSNTSQTIMFTCHKNIFDIIKQNDIQSKLISLV